MTEVCKLMKAMGRVSTQLRVAKSCGNRRGNSLKLVDVFKWSTRQPTVGGDLLALLPIGDCGEREPLQDQKGIRQTGGQQRYRR